MRTPFRLPAVTLVLAAALAVSGCTPDKPSPVPSVSRSGTPLFASDEEALAAAEEAYAAYLAVYDAILIDGGMASERLLQVATPEQYEYEKAGFESAVLMGYRSSGGSTFDRASLQSLSSNGSNPVATVYLCEDVSAVDIRDASGVSVVPAGRADRFPLLVEFESSDGAALSLKVSGIEEWTGTDFCLES